MGTFARTAIVLYRLSFADQGKQISIFRLKRQHTAISVCLLQTGKYIYIHLYLLPFQTENGSPGDFP
jgi:hypothetical protein